MKALAQNMAHLYSFSQPLRFRIKAKKKTRLIRVCYLQIDHTLQVYCLCI
jgi:hypothetical protein